MKTKTTYSLATLCALSLLALPAAFASHSEDQFKKIDTDGDGFLSRAEHAVHASQMFATMDANHDGVVTPAEMEACKDLLSDGAGHMEMSTADMFKMCDANADGKITAAEHAASCDAVFTTMDANSDGKLSLDECKAGHKAKPDKKQ